MYEKEHPTQNQLEDMLDDGVNHVMLINERGRIESIASRTDIQLPKERQEIFFMGFRLQQSLLQEFDDEFGNVEQFVVSRKEAKIVSIPFGSRSLIFIMDKAYDHRSLVAKASAIRKNSFEIQKLNTLCEEAIPNG